MVPKPLFIPLSSPLMPPVSGTLEPNQREISPLIDRQKKVQFCALSWSLSDLVFLSFLPSVSLLLRSRLWSDCLPSFPSSSLSLSLSLVFREPSSPSARLRPIIHSDRKGWRKHGGALGNREMRVESLFKALSLNTVYKSAELDRRH